MYSHIKDEPVQRFFPFLEEVQPPTLAPLSDVAEFETEADAVNYSVNKAIRERRGLTQMQLADDMRITRAVMSKLRQFQVAMPMGKFQIFMETTRSYAVLQFHAMRAGLVLKTREEEQETQQKLERLTRELEDYKTRYRRVVGE